MPGFFIPLQVPTKTILSNSDVHNDPNTSENFACQDNSSAATSHYFQFQITATLPFSHFNTTRRGVPLYTSFTDFVNSFEKNSTATNQSKRSNDPLFMLTKTTFVPSLSIDLLA